MKKALAILSVLALGSTSQSNNFLSDNELRIRPISYNPAENFISEDLPQEYFRGFPTNSPKLVYVDDEQYARPNIVKNWHYPLPPLPVTNTYVPSPVQTQAHIEEDSVENVLFDLGQMVKQQPRKREPVSKPSRRMRPEQPPQDQNHHHQNPGHMFYLPPSGIPVHRQHR